MLSAISIIENEVTDIKENINALLRDQEQIQLNIENDPKFNEFFNVSLSKKSVTDSVDTASKDLQIEAMHFTNKNDILMKDQEYVAEIEALKIVQSLGQSAQDFASCLDRFEFESAFGSLKKTFTTYETLMSSYRSTISPQLSKSITTKLDNMHLQLLEKMVCAYQKSYSEDDSHCKLRIAKSGTKEDVSVAELNIFVMQTVLESSIDIEVITGESSMVVVDTWFIDSMIDSSVVLEKCIHLLNHIIIEYIKLQSISEEYVKNALFQHNVSIDIKKENKNVWEVTKTKHESEQPLDSRLNTIGNVTALFDFVSQDSSYNFHKLKQTIVKQIENFIKNNIKSIFNEKNVHLKKLLLDTISQSNTLQNSNLMNLLKDGDTHIYTSIIMDKIVADGFDNLRNLFQDDSLMKRSRHVAIETVKAKKSEQDKNAILNMSKSNDSLQLDDGWGWDEGLENKDVAKKSETAQDSSIKKTKETETDLANTSKNWVEGLDVDEDDGWGVEDEDMLDLDGSQSVVSKGPLSEPTPVDKTFGDEDLDLDEDAWSTNESLNLEDVDKLLSSQHLEKPKSAVPKHETVSLTFKDQFSVTEVAFQFLDIWKIINIKIAQELPQTKDTNKQYRLNLLQTSFYSLCTSQYDGDWIKFVNDSEYMKYEMTHNSSFQDNCNLDQFFHLGSNLIHTKVQMVEKRLSSLIEDQLKTIKNHESIGDPDWSVTFDKLLPKLNSFFHETVTQIGVQKMRFDIVLQVVEFFYENCIIKSISEWNVISEIASENVSEFIQLITGNIDELILPQLEQCKLKQEYLPKFTDLRERILMVSRVLTARLKDIMDMLYNGDFYLFETQEIINWIILLFADTKKRTDCIEEIKTLREEAE